MDNVVLANNVLVLAVSADCGGCGTTLVKQDGDEKLDLLFSPPEGLEIQCNECGAKNVITKRLYEVFNPSRN